MGSRASIIWRMSQFHLLELLDPGIDMIYNRKDESQWRSRNDSPAFVWILYYAFTVVKDLDDPRISAPW